MNTRLFGWCWLLLIGVSLSGLVGCGGGGGGDSSSSSVTGTVSIGLTDNQTLYNAVVLTIQQVGVVRNDGLKTYYNSAGSVSFPTTVDVLDYPGEHVLPLVDIEVPLPEDGSPVCFNQIRLVLAAEGDPTCLGPFCNYVVGQDDPTPYLLTTPSGQQSGVKVLTPNEFCMTPGDDTVRVVIDFDPAKAIVHNENQGQGNPNDKYLLKPTGIRIIEGEFSGAPADFIGGVVAVPAAYDNTILQCVTYAAEPEVTVTGQLTNSALEPVTTVSQTTGPLTHAETCAELCVDDANCLSDCQTGLTGECYYLGNFKLLLPVVGTYDVSATWDQLSADATAAPSGEDNLLLELGQ